MTHGNSQYHKTCAKRAIEFWRWATVDCTSDVRNLQDEARRSSILQNRKNLEPIVDTILFCGRQNLALRGHRDCGRISPQERLENDVNFRALLRLRIHAGDVVLQDRRT